MSFKKFISDSSNPKEIKRKFLGKNPKYSEIEDSKEALGDFFTINDDDEVWLMQCPKGMDISLLKDQKIKLPGRSNQNEFETVATEFPEIISHAFAHKNKKGHNSVKMIPTRGSIVMRRRLKALTPPDASANETTFKVPMPTNIKQRHPLHGADFNTKINISPEIANRLKYTWEVPLDNQRSKTSSKQKSNTIDVDSDGEVQLVLQKKQKIKKKKRKVSSGVDDTVDSPKKRKVKHNSQTEDLSDDLQWIQKL